jgi:hypothetical protein
MFGVTGSAVHGAVKTLELIELDLLRLMAGQTRRGEIFSQGEVKGSMRIGMTLQASFKFIMALPAVTLAALGYNFQDVGRMSRVTVHTAHCGFMGPAFFSNIFRRFGVTFNTVAACQDR